MIRNNRLILVAFMITHCLLGANGQSSPPVLNQSTPEAGRTQQRPTKRRASRSVLDYYLMLPEKYLTVLEGVKNRKSIIAIDDTKNGYLKLEGEWEGWAEVALFKRSDGDDMMGVVYVGCGPVCAGYPQFLLYRGGAWTDVTEQVLPEITNQMVFAEYRRQQPGDNDHSETDPPFINYELPRRGTTIKVNANTGGDGGALIFKMRWDGEKFKLTNNPR